MILSKLVSNILVDEIIDDVNACIKNINLVDELNDSNEYNFDSLYKMYDKNLIKLVNLEKDLSKIDEFIDEFIEEISKLLIEEKQSFNKTNKKEQENKKRIFEFIIFVQNKLMNCKKVIISFNWILNKMGLDIEINKQNEPEFYSLIEFNISKRFKTIREQFGINISILDSSDILLEEFETFSLNGKKKLLEKILRDINFDSILEMNDVEEIIRISKLSTSINFLIKFIDVVNFIRKTI
ncbi:hypothetical protein [Mesoplasma coleopterae]|uniref:Uncharacterized protein n=1 Tax=Mesoplasma coleopterae TaxID=324078 RepID=A0A2K8P302_9MOLU|nr:hypothetical protein [Mesoplasma coleopterae]ATZ20878.1 hypothetical protein MCOLE_v1c03640 [Mesoplasma coleopterae]AVN62378.1 hypothetical protein CG001_01810 [Mesoplasma coleopterae]AVN63063.1 hypothetical protein CG000_01955 [Mesoplasma coleopterae]